MEAYKKVTEYRKLFKDGVISEEEYYKLKHMIFVSNKQELGVEDEDAFDDLVNRECFNEAMKKLEINTSKSYSEAISMLEDLGDWGSAAIVAEQCRQELQTIKEQEEQNGIEIHSNQNDQVSISDSDVIDSFTTNNETSTPSDGILTKLGIKLTKKTIIIIAAAAVALLLLIPALQPQVDHYYIEYRDVYSGESTASIKSGIELYAVYADKTEKKLDKSSWSITDPSTLYAPETQITIKYKGKEIYFNLDVKY